MRRGLVFLHRYIGLSLAGFLVITGLIVALTGAPVERHGYRPAASSRWFGLGGTMLTVCLVVTGFFVTLSTVVVKQAAPPTLTVMEIRPAASPPETPPKERDAPKPTERKQPSEPVRTVPVRPTILPIPPVTGPIPADTKIADPAPKEPETAALRTAPAPLAPQMSSTAPDTWEGRLLAQLGKHRRYPRMAQLRRQQGVPWIRFVMNREGRVLSVRLERSSGVADLDREAVALPKRAQPLPKPPDDKPGDTLELVVPVEFFLK